MTKPKSKVTDEGSAIMGPVSNSVAGDVFGNRPGWSSSAGDDVEDNDLFREG
jgi:hypothetical protein